MLFHEVGKDLIINPARIVAVSTQGTDDRIFLLYGKDKIKVSFESPKERDEEYERLKKVLVGGAVKHRPI